jgi:hypothetical protein
MSNVVPFRRDVFVCCEHDAECEYKGTPCCAHPWTKVQDQEAVDLFLVENANRGVTFNDWILATESFREGYRNAVRGGIKRRSAPNFDPDWSDSAAEVSARMWPVDPREARPNPDTALALHWALIAALAVGLATLAIFIGR